MQPKGFLTNQKGHSGRQQRKGKVHPQSSLGSQNHREVWVGRDFKDHLVPPPARDHRDSIPAARLCPIPTALGEGRENRDAPKTSRIPPTDLSGHSSSGRGSAWGGWHRIPWERGRGEVAPTGRRKAAVLFLPLSLSPAFAPWGLPVGGGFFWVLFCLFPQDGTAPFALHAARSHKPGL